MRKSWPHRWHLLVLATDPFLKVVDGCSKTNGALSDRGKVLTDVPRIQECEDCADGEEIVKLWKGRHLDRSELVQNSSNWLVDGQSTAVCEKPGAPFIAPSFLHVQYSPS